MAAEPAEAFAGPLRHVIDRLDAEPSRTWSLIVTVYGDAILPRGGSVWLGTLIRFCDAIGVGAGVVRTAMSRLAADRWVDRNRVGRNSFYRLSPQGEATFREAAGRIYDPNPQGWAGEFELLLAENGLSEADRAALRDGGLGSPLPGLWLCPTGGRLPPVPMLRLNARTDEGTARLLAARSWNLERMADSYRRFVEAFAPLEAQSGDQDETASFVARILLIHEFRRIVLHDPNLPPQILPAGWPGTDARALCGRLYHRLLPASERWLDAVGRTESGALPPPGPEFDRRFRS